MSDTFSRKVSWIQVALNLVSAFTPRGPSNPPGAGGLAVPEAQVGRGQVGVGVLLPEAVDRIQAVALVSTSL